MNQHIKIDPSKFASKDDAVISVVIPVYNEEKNLYKIVEKLTEILGPVEPNHEIILVDDGSTDQSVREAHKCIENFARVKFLRLSRNFGKEAALNAGVAHATGQAVIQIDADLQHPPELILKFIEEWRNGIDIVYGERISRNNETAIRRFFTVCFYKIFSLISDVKLMKGLGDFLLMDRKVVDALLCMPERERFTKGLYAWVGFERKSIPFEVNERIGGQSSFNLFKLFSFAVNAIVSFGTIPLKVWTYIGLGLAIPSFGYGLFTILKTAIYGVDVPGYASLMVAVCFFAGIQLCGLGILGEYLGRVLSEVKQRPIYLVSQKLGFKEQSSNDDEKQVIKADN